MAARVQVDHTMILKSLIFAVCFSVVLARRSPNANQIDKLAKFSKERFSNSVIEDARLDAPGLARKYGYPLEIHKVETDDGYILEMHRIPHGKDEDIQRGNRSVVFLMHGLLSSSADWILNGPGKGFGYILADAGYDVWLGNARGSYYSRKHKSKDTSKSSFWDFSWHQIGHTDLATMVDYVIAQTGQRKIHYTGHSQGTTSFFVLASTRPEYNSKFKSVQALAPVAFMKNMKSPLVRFLAPFTNILTKLTELVGLNEFLPKTRFLTKVGGFICKENSIFAPICSNTLFILCGFNTDQLNKTMLPVYVGHAPAGASTKQVVHYGQGVKHGSFRQFDHGRVKNLIKYGSMKPPVYRLDLISAPVALHYSDNDWMADVGDVHRLFEGLARPIGKFRVPLDKFNHLDFIYAIDAKKLLYDRVLDLIKRYD